MLLVPTATADSMLGLPLSWRSVAQGSHLLPKAAILATVLPWLRRLQGGLTLKWLNPAQVCTVAVGESPRATSIVCDKPFAAMACPCEVALAGMQAAMPVKKSQPYTYGQTMQSASARPCR